MLVLLAALWLAVRFGLRPLRLMSSEISEIEEGRREALSEEYPRELAGVGRGFNTLLRSERQRMERYRTTMDDLAHSLKTPLAVVRNEIGGPQPDRATLTAQVERMQSVIDYQLKRAAAMGPRSLAAKAVPLEPVLTELVASLRKIHRDRAVACELHVPDGASYPAEQGDLYEILGNLLDNAWKWCREKIVVTVRTGDLLEVSVEDDGPGIPEDIADRLFQPFVSGRPGGSGLGLAIVQRAVEAHRGLITVTSAVGEGTTFTIFLPTNWSAEEDE